MEHDNKIARQLMFEFMEFVEGELDAIVRWAGIELDEENRQNRRSKRAMLKAAKSYAAIDHPEPQSGRRTSRVGPMMMSPLGST